MKSDLDIMKAPQEAFTEPLGARPQATRHAATRPAVMARLTTLLVAAANAALIWIMYAASMSGMLQSVKPHVGMDDRALFLCYTAAGLSAMVLACLGLTALATLRCRGYAVPLITAILCGCGSIAAVLDTKLFTVLGVHIYDPMVLANMRNPHLGDELQLGTATLLTVGILIIGLFVAETVILRGCLRIARGTAGRAAARWRAGIFGCTAMCAASSIFAVYFAQPAVRHDSPVLTALPLYGPLLAPARTQWPLDLNYPGAVPTAPPTMARRPDILLLVAESFRGDVIGPRTTPRLQTFLDTRATIRSDHHDAGCHVTEFGVFGLLYGLNAYHYSPFMNSRQASYPLEIFKANDYQLVGTVATRLSEWNFADFLFDQFDIYEEFADGPAYDNDRTMVEWITRWRSRRDPDRPALLLAFFNSTHHNYVYPPEFEVHTPVLDEDHNYFVETDRLKDQRELIFNRYLNSVGYVDHLVGELLETFKDDIASGNLVVVFTGDHGEEFWERGLLGHSATRFVNERTRVPLIMSLPGTHAAVDISSHADIMPTLLDYVGLDPIVASETYANGRSLLAPPPSARVILTAGAGFPVSNDYVAISTAAGKHWMRKVGPRMRDLRPVLSTDLQDNKHPHTGGPELERLRSTYENEFYRFLTETPTPDGPRMK